jgi:hypothetical protein
MLSIRIVQVEAEIVTMLISNHAIIHTLEHMISRFPKPLLALPPSSLDSNQG